MSRANLLPVLFFLLLFVSCREKWVVYAADEFTIEFPEAPGDTATISERTVNVKVFYEPETGSGDSNLYYSLSVYSLSDSIAILGDDLKDFFKKDVQIFAWSIGAGFEDTGRVVTSGKTQGREYTVVMADNTVATVRKFAYGKNLYTLMVITGGCCYDNSQQRKYFESFKLK
ncbi:MAG TPA: hypothetical protein VI731_10005 [Bacteroidia bacterium]|nr:hypothetical protein [Bacteroidia bacterium]